MKEQLFNTVNAVIREKFGISNEEVFLRGDNSYLYTLKGYNILFFEKYGNTVVELYADIDTDMHTFSTSIEFPPHTPVVLEIESIGNYFARTIQPILNEHPMLEVDEKCYFPGSPGFFVDGDNTALIHLRVPELEMLTGDDVELSLWCKTGETPALIIPVHTPLNEVFTDFYDGNDFDVNDIRKFDIPLPVFAERYERLIEYVRENRTMSGFTAQKSSLKP